MPKIVKKKAIKKTGPSKGLVYFTTRALERAVKKGTKDLAQVAHKLVGYTVKEADGWVVKEYADGNIERITKIKIIHSPKTLVLD
jgi:hypothetical protein